MKKKLNILKNKSIINKKKIYFIFSFVFIFTSFLFFYNNFLREIPSNGGTFYEIQINTNLRFVNPVLAKSNAEKDLLPLIYSPLLNKEKKDIAIIDSFSLDDSKKKYNIKIKENIFFSDDQKITTDDIIFTIKKILDPEVNSPYYGNWVGAEYEKKSETEMEITIPEEYLQFEETLSSLYVMPKSLWENLSPTEFEHNILNINPIGSGPYVVKEISRTKSGKIQSYQIAKNSKWWSKTYIEKIIFYFFEDYKEYMESSISKNKRIIKNISGVDIDLANELSSEEYFLDSKIEKIENTKNFGIFINKEYDGFLNNKILRKYISQIIDRNKIVEDSLSGYARKINSPILNFKKEKEEKVDIEKIKEELKKNDYNFIEDENGFLVLLEKQKDFPEQPVIITMKAVDSIEFRKITQNIKEDLKKIGINLIINYYQEDILANSIIRNRDFEMILFGYQTNINPDLYYFFHSSQISDPGINIIGIRNTKLDKMILNLRKNIESEEREKLYEEIDKIIFEEYTFIPLYSPYFLYIKDERIKNFQKNIINNREERFLGLKNWYIKTKKVLDN